MATRTTNPARSRPRSRPSAPEKREMTVPDFATTNFPWSSAGRGSILHIIPVRTHVVQIEEASGWAQPRDRQCPTRFLVITAFPFACPAFDGDT